MLDDPLSQPLEIPVRRRARDCTVEDWLAFLGHRWNACLLWHLSTGAKTFGTLQTNLQGVSAKVLTERLVVLEKRGLITRESAASFPRTVTYALAARGKEILKILRQIERLE